MQLKDKIDFSTLKDKKQLIRSIVFSILKFLVVFAISFIAMYLLIFIGIFWESDFPAVMVIILSISLLLSLVSCTFELTTNLYFSDDNRVLITLPVTTNKIFVSRIIVFYIYELKKSLNFLVPLTLACVSILIYRNLTSFWMLLWVIIPLIFILMLPVLLGALLSIIVMYVRRFLQKVPVLKIILFLTVLTLVVIGVVHLINIIPIEIDLIHQWSKISVWIRNFFMLVETKLVVMRQLISTIIGEMNHMRRYVLNLHTFANFGILILVCVVLVLLVYLISRPIYFNMMAKNFEINKNITNNKPNKKHHKYLTFLNKEFVINLRTMSISVNYLMIYVIVPILILFLNKIYSNMNLDRLGKLLSYAVNILLICLPLLSSNALVATYYSREGRAGYIKKTKPVNIVYPLFTKLIFNMLFSLPTVFVTCAIFGVSAGFNFMGNLLLGFTILFIHFAHMIYSATLDIMNPQNEQYATTGDNIDNPNETKSTILAFIISAICALVAYKLLSEAVIIKDNINFGFVKMFIISLFFFIVSIVMFAKKVKAFYYEL